MIVTDDILRDFAYSGLRMTLDISDKLDELGKQIQDLVEGEKIDNSVGKDINFLRTWHAKRNDLGQVMISNRYEYNLQKALSHFASVEVPGLDDADSCYWWRKSIWPIRNIWSNVMREFKGWIWDNTEILQSGEVKARIFSPSADSTAIIDYLFVEASDITEEKSICRLEICSPSSMNCVDLYELKALCV